MLIEIEYCVPCGYLERATEAQTRLLEEFGNAIEGVTLKTGRKGVFRFTADGETLYTKPDEYDIDHIAGKVRAMLPAAQTVEVGARDLLNGEKP